MNLKVEVAVSQLNKYGEELCGDCVEIAQDGYTVIVMSDGLGSGVKAHILASLTTKMAATMLKGGLPLGEVIDSVASTLPVCEVRRLAYSTFSILIIGPDYKAHLVEYDNPLAFLGRGSELVTIDRQKKTYSGRVVQESFFQVNDGDWLVLVSDGVLHAGIGGIWNLGWGWNRIGDYLKRMASREEDARSMAFGLIETTERLYAGKPGDDATVVAVRIRAPRYLTVLAGPPVDMADDARVVAEFMASPGKKAICGGTTSLIVARETGHPVTVNMATMREGIPPTGQMEGVDLVCEGVLTLSRVADLFKDGAPLRRNLIYRSDGPSRLASLLLESDNIRFMVGRAINPAHQSPDLPIDLALKRRIIEDLCRRLNELGKNVRLDVY
ncbi:MAG TPA: SpoIIE family protein phosphatase [Firmicutes bacterium]|nr:SpoIIE family protein phosphatase [Candidatus Fermentithermobacillaceae bacterium]